MFGFWDWVGGRYSMDSAIGLSLMIAIGPDDFRELLAGFRAMDEHFLTTPMEPQPAGPAWPCWGSGTATRSAGRPTRSCPTARSSTGSRPTSSSWTWSRTASRSGSTATRVTYDTGPIVWGTAGTNGQHAYYQLLHQGTRIVPADLIGFVNPTTEIGDHHDLLMANLFAQAEAFAFGKTRDEVVADGVPEHQVDARVFEGNRPTSVILADRLTPRTLGTLVALYEHKVFVQGVIWGVGTVRPVGRGAGQGARDADRRRADGRVRGRVARRTTRRRSALIRRYRQRRQRPTASGSG